MYIFLCLPNSQTLQSITENPEIQECREILKNDGNENSKKRGYETEKWKRRF